MQEVKRCRKGLSRIQALSIWCIKTIFFQTITNWFKFFWYHRINFIDKWYAEVKVHCFFDGQYFLNSGGIWQASCVRGQQSNNRRLKQFRWFRLDWPSIWTGLRVEWRDCGSVKAAWFWSSCSVEAAWLQSCSVGVARLWIYCKLSYWFLLFNLNLEINPDQTPLS